MIGVPLRLGLGTGANVCDGNFRRGECPALWSMPVRALRQRVNANPLVADAWRLVRPSVAIATI